MFNIFYIQLGPLALLLIWVFGTLKSVLFWLYLWQLKDYHIGRFVDHFRTSKGKKAFFNITIVIKILLALWLLCTYVFGGWEYLIWGYAAFIIIYVVETYRAAVGLAKGTLKKPVFTGKIILLFSVIVVGMVAFFQVSLARIAFDPSILLLMFDIVAAVIVSLVVLFFQPLFVLGRNRILQKAMKKMAQYPKVKVIAITGSYGKTSTKEFLTTILSQKFKVLSTPDHKNSEIGIAQTILKDLKPEHEIFVVEMGSYNRGGISLLCDIVEPEIGVGTGVNEQQL